MAKLDWKPVSRATRCISTIGSPGTRTTAQPLMPLEAGQWRQDRAARARQFTQGGDPDSERDATATRSRVRLPDEQVALGVNAQQNPPLSFACMLGGAYVAFPRTQADADAKREPPPGARALQDRNDYVNQIRIAARSLEHDGFLLPEDARSSSSRRPKVRCAVARAIAAACRQTQAGPMPYDVAGLSAASDEPAAALLRAITASDSASTASAWFRCQEHDTMAAAAAG